MSTSESQVNIDLKSWHLQNDNLIINNVGLPVVWNVISGG